MEKKTKKFWSSFDTFDKGPDNEDVYQAIFEGLCNIELNGTIVVLKRSALAFGTEVNSVFQFREARHRIYQAPEPRILPASIGGEMNWRCSGANIEIICQYIEIQGEK